MNIEKSESQKNIEKAESQVVQVCCVCKGKALSMKEVAWDNFSCKQILGLRENFKYFEREKSNTATWCSFTHLRNYETEKCI